MQCFRDGVEQKHWLCAPFEHARDQNLNSELSPEIYGHFLLVCWKKTKILAINHWSCTVGGELSPRSRLRLCILHIAHSLLSYFPWESSLALSVLGSWRCLGQFSGSEPNPHVSVCVHIINFSCPPKQDGCIPNCPFQMIFGPLWGCLHSPPLERRLHNPTC